ncbi:QRFP-like peptide receptor [Dreissena polymorpha]|uniref:QRFP-like peptide receptor n=1 Tax=Dreissena polymorpha TaxID=45954 RepID=UPI0022646ABA|nr:QRFP-like peptide receptor [Dreissena polymorpha]
MDQLPDLLTYRTLLEVHKNESIFNFSVAKDIIEDFEENLYTHNKFSTVVLLTLYAPIFILGMCGNILIAASVTSDRARKGNLYFLVNLALADLVVTVMCIPTSIGTIVYRLWVYGRFLCKFTAFIQGVAVAVSIFSMTAMSIDRYYSLKKPMNIIRRVSSSGQSCCLILSMWIVASIFMSPLLFIRDIDIVHDIPFLRPMTFCIEQWPQDRDRKAYGVFLLFVVFIIPAFTIGVCYGNVGRALCVTDRQTRFNSDGSTNRLVSRRQAARMVIILICVFMVCWLPYSVISALADISENATIIESLPFVLWLGHAHSAINPMLYWSLNKRFRDNIQKMGKVISTRCCFSKTTDSSWL